VSEPEIKIGNCESGGGLRAAELKKTVHGLDKADIWLYIIIENDYQYL
jgi:hypothetical protein